jgi:magnesium chelatase accessory protein
VHSVTPADWPHAHASQRVEAGGLQWHVQVMGQGPALWLLHGTGAASHSWRALMPVLAREHTVVVPDLPGHGYSGALPRAERSLPGMARALAALAQQMSLPPQAIAGHSAGAALALRAVLDGQFAPHRLLGINAALLPFDGLAGLVFPPLARVLARSHWLPQLVARRARDGSAVRRLVASTGSRLDADGLTLYARLITTPSHVAGALDMMANWDLASLWHDLPRLAIPLTLLVGGRDATVPPAQAQRVVRRLPGTTVHTLPGLGHLAHEEDPVAVGQWLGTWLQQRATAAATAASPEARRSEPPDLATPEP